jgi:hypothetical protein
MGTDNSEQELTKAFEALRGGKTLTARQRRLVKGAAEAAIDNFMREVGISDPPEFTDEDGFRELTYGSAQGLAFVDEEDKTLYLHAEAFVMKLPSDQELIVPLFRELLEMNLTMPGAARFAIRRDAVVIVATEEVGVLRDDDDYARQIHTVMTCADAIDSDLVKRFGGTTRRRAAAAKAAAVRQRRLAGKKAAKTRKRSAAAANAAATTKHRRAAKEAGAPKRAGNAEQNEQ